MVTIVASLPMTLALIQRRFTFLLLVSNMQCVKYACERIYTALTKVYNQSLEQGIVPDLLKLSKVTLIDKGVDTTDVTNFSPISTLSAFIQIFEKLVYKQRVSDIERSRLNRQLLRSQIS